MRISLIIVCAITLMSCGGNRQKSLDESQTPSPQEEQLILDSVSTAVDAAKQDIDKTVDELDTLIKDLEIK